MGLFILFLFFTRNPRRCCPERSLVSVGLSLSTAATAAGHPLLQLALSRLPPPALLLRALRRLARSSSDVSTCTSCTSSKASSKLSTCWALCGPCTSVEVVVELPRRLVELVRVRASGAGAASGVVI